MSKYKRSQLQQTVDASLEPNATEEAKRLGGEALLMLANSSAIWQDSFNTVEKARLDAEAELMVLEATPNADANGKLAAVYAQKALIAKLLLERAEIERDRHAFSADNLSINPPSQDLARQVKSLCAEVEAEVIKSQATVRITELVSKLAVALRSLTA